MHILHYTLQLHLLLHVILALQQFITDFLQTINYDSQEVQLNLHHHRITGDHKDKGQNWYKQLIELSLFAKTNTVTRFHQQCSFDINNKNKVSYQWNLSVEVVARQLPFLEIE